MDKQKLISFFFDFTGMDLDKLLEGLGIDEKFETQKIQNAVNDFEKYILERHGDNPSYEGIAKFWKENQVSENIFSIILDTKKDYSDFKDSLNYDNYLNQSEKELSIELMDLLYSKLLELITELSNDSKSTILAILKPILDGQNRMEKNILELLNKIDKSEVETNKSETFSTKAEFKNKEIGKESVSEKNLNKSDFADTPNFPRYPSVFFKRRFEESFPESTNKDFNVYSDNEVIKDRLSNFFTDFKYSGTSPIVKVRGREYEFLSKINFENGKILIKTLTPVSIYELKINKLIVFNFPDYFKKFIMIEVSKDDPADFIGDENESELNSTISSYVYSDGKYYTSQASKHKKYIENGKLCSIDGEVEERYRFMEKYNFFIVHQFHPLFKDFHCYHRTEKLLDKLLSCSNEEEDELFSKISNLIKITDVTKYEDDENCEANSRKQ